MLAEWKDKPDKTGYYWLANKMCPASQIVFYYNHDKSLATIGKRVVIKLDDIYSDYPESLFQYIGDSPPNPFKGKCEWGLEPRGPWHKTETLLSYCKQEAKVKEI